MPPSPSSVERPEGEQQRGGDYMATRTTKDETLWDEEHHLLRMDPSLITESQQLAFLPRTTAHEASGTFSSATESRKT
ncbi:unnamed protein product [Hyaloperonospora brassicae]|uniref:RxLR effector candidate protein n=1 Tax=Hyaloperonospora brassicae TaxID=162125 RepID=A0AAV0T5I2_HYABA|nr:unnamed protein product [Hyaloperonospora brassicae]